MSDANEKMNRVRIEESEAVGGVGREVARDLHDAEADTVNLYGDRQDWKDGQKQVSKELKQVESDVGGLTGDQAKTDAEFAVLSGEADGMEELAGDTMVSGQCIGSGSE